MSRICRSPGPTDLRRLVRSRAAFPASAFHLLDVPLVMWSTTRSGSGSSGSRRHRTQTAASGGLRSLIPVAGLLQNLSCRRPDERPDGESRIDGLLDAAERVRHSWSRNGCRTERPGGRNETFTSARMLPCSIRAWRCSTRARCRGWRAHRHRRFRERGRPHPRSAWTISISGTPARL